MDKLKFDALTRAFATGTSRRTAIKGLFGGAVGVAVASTRLDRVGAQTCETSEDCFIDSCTVVDCVEGTCQIVEGGCPAGEFCCPAQGGSCAPCCSDADCPLGTPICYIPGDPSDAICVQCVADSDCAQPDACTLPLCVDNVCSTASACPAGETCCDVPGVGIDCVNLNAPDDQYCGACGVVCGPCESCVGGTCTPYAEYCPETQQCYERMEGECCYDHECGDGYCVDGWCRSCRYDSDCPDCEVCGLDGYCHPLLCEFGETCCDGHACVPEDECCRGIGDFCGLLDEVTAAEGSPQLDCCDGLVCCENWNSQYPICAECCNHWDCPKGAYCNEGWCEYPDLCDHDKDCPKGTCCCKDGTCSGKCCHHHHHPHKPHKPKPPKPAPDTPVTTLPATGAGESSDSSGILGAAALGAAAALYAAKKMRETPEASTEE